MRCRGRLAFLGIVEYMSYQAPRSAQPSPRGLRRWVVPGVFALGPILVFVLTYWIALRMRSAQLIVQWQARPEIENWALPLVDARPQALQIALLTTGAAIIMVIVLGLTTRGRRPTATRATGLTCRLE